MLSSRTVAERKHRAKRPARSQRRRTYGWQRMEDPVRTGCGQGSTAATVAQMQCRRCNAGGAPVVRQAVGTASVDTADAPAIAAAQSARRILDTDSMENGYVGAH